MAVVKQIKTNKNLTAPKESVEKYPKFYLEGNEEKNISDILSNMVIDDEYYQKIEIEYNNVNRKKVLQFTTHSLPYCCGIIEIGDLSCDSGFESKHLIEILDGLPTLVKHKTLIMNTNGRNGCVQLEAVLPKCKNWVLVKTFKNGGNGNTIKMWVSNND